MSEKEGLAQTRKVPTVSSSVSSDQDGREFVSTLQLKLTIYTVSVCEHFLCGLAKPTISFIQVSCEKNFPKSKYKVICKIKRALTTVVLIKPHMLNNVVLIRNLISQYLCRIQKFCTQKFSFIFKCGSIFWAMRTQSLVHQFLMR